jgi:hypothetical protein
VASAACMTLIAASRTKASPKPLMEPSFGPPSRADLGKWVNVFGIATRVPGRLWVRHSDCYFEVS